MGYRVCSTHCRRRGAIGIFHPDAVTVEADTPEAALLKAYDYLEHISFPVIVPVEDEPAESEDR